jgi:O-antigen ligase
MVPLRYVDRFRTVIVLLALGTTGLLVFSPTYDQFVLPKAAWVAVLTILLAVLAFMRLSAGGDVRLRLHWINLALLLFVAWKAASIAWARSRSLAVENASWWGVLFLWCLLFQDWLGASTERLSKLSIALTISALLLALWVILQDFAVPLHLAYQGAVSGESSAAAEHPLFGLFRYLTGLGAIVPKLPDWRGFLWAGFGNTSHIGDYLAFLFPMIGMQYLLARRTAAIVLSLVTLIASAAALIAAYSVASNAGLFLAAVAMIVLLAIYEPRGFWRERIGRVALILVLFTGVVAFYVLPSPLNPHHGGIFHQAFQWDEPGKPNRWKEGWPTRLAIWINSMEMVRHNPVLGIGAGNFTYGYTATLSPAVLGRPELARYAGLYTNAAHNEPIQAWVETGVVGLALLLLLWTALLWAGLGPLTAETPERERRVRILIFSMMVAFLVHSMMNFTLQLPTSSLLFVTLVGVAATIGRDPTHFALSFRLPYRFIEIDLETSGMRKIESIGLRHGESRIARIVITLLAIHAGVFAMVNPVRRIVADSLFSEGLQAQRENRLDRAENLARRALAINPNHHTARKLLGRVLLAKPSPDPKGARDALERVKERETVVDFYNDLGWAYWRLDERDKAGETWEVYFGRIPGTPFLPENRELFSFFAKQFPDRAQRVLMRYRKTPGAPPGSLRPGPPSDSPPTGTPVPDFGRGASQR